MNPRNRTKIIIAAAAAVVFIAICVTGTVLNVKRFRKNFQNEMAQRLDLEEKISKMEAERAALLSELEVLQGQMTKDKQEVVRLKGELSRRQNEETVLREELEKTKKELQALSLSGNSTVVISEKAGGSQ